MAKSKARKPKKQPAIQHWAEFTFYSPEVEETNPMAQTGITFHNQCEAKARSPRWWKVIVDYQITNGEIIVEEQIAFPSKVKERIGIIGKDVNDELNKRINLSEGWRVIKGHVRCYIVEK